MALVATVGLLATLGVPTAHATPAAPSNPNLGQACGLDFALVLDRSGSVSSAGASGTVKAAAKAFLDALVDTGSTVSLTSFATTATVDQAATALNTANLAGLKGKVDSLHFGDYTNWEDALIKAQSTFGGFPGSTPKPDLVVMITDGNPNRYMSGSTVSSSGGTATALSEAVGQANTIKGAGTHMFTLGVTGSSGLNTANLQAVSGTDQWPATAFASADWTQITSFNALQTALLDIATELCGGTVIVQKTVDGVPAAGWHFSATNGATSAGAGNTDDQGLVSFAWDSPLTQGTDVSETSKAGYALKKATCTLNGNEVGSPIANGVHLNVGPLDTIRCAFDNHKLSAEIHVDKTASPATVVAGGAVAYGYAVTNPGEAPLSGVTVSDDKCSPVTFVSGDGNANGLLDHGETWTYSCSAHLAVDTTNTATASGQPPVGDRVSDTDTAFVDVINPNLDIKKSGPAQAREGDTVTYDFTVENTGDTTLTGIAVTDDILGDIGTIDSLAPTGKATLHKQYTVPSGHPADIVNVATACVSGLPGRDTPLCDSDSHTLDVIHPAIHVDKSADRTVITAGTTVHYGYEVTNPGDVALSGATVGDDKCGPVAYAGGDTDGDHLLDPGETWTFGCAAVISVDTINTATASGQPPVGGPVTATDTASVDVVHPALAVHKSSDPPAKARPGDAVTYHIAVENTGDVVLHGVSVTDDILGPIGTIAVLGVGQTVTLDKDYTVEGSGDVTNTATACVVGAPGLGDRELCGHDSHTLDVINPAIHIAKSASAAEVTAGTTVTYGYTVTNPGDVPLSNVTVVDDKCAPVTFTGGDTNGSATLDPAETWSYHCTAAISQDTENIATATGTPPVGPDVVDRDSAFVDVVNPMLSIEKSGPAQAGEGDTITYHFTVSNTGDVPLSGITVDDDVLGHIGTIESLDAGHSTELEKSYTVPSNHPDDVVNVATACVSGAPGMGEEPICDSAGHRLDVLHPAITVVKTADRVTILAGATVVYRYDVTNPGDTPLSGLTVSDDKCAPVTFSGGDADENGLLDPGETWTYHCSAALSADTVNTATATGTDPIGATVSDTDVATVDVVNPLLRITKTGPAAAHEGDSVLYTFTVANTGDVTLANLTVSDDVIGAVGTIDSLAPGAVATLTARYVIPLNRTEDVTNTAVVCTGGPPPGAADSGAKLCDSDIHVLDVLHPAITIDKTVSPDTVSTAGPVTYRYVVTNTGDATLHDVFVTDDILGAIGSVGSLAPGEILTMFKTVTVDASTPPTNLGTATGTDVLGKDVTASDPATITVVLGEQVSRPVPAPAGELPRTGGPLGAETKAAIALIEIGVLLQLSAWRRRRWSRRMN